MKVVELFGRGRPVFSFEFFLPRTPEGMVSFRAALADLSKLSPSFVTLTYGAGGSARERTIETAGMMRNELGLETVAHLTGVAHTRAEIDAILARIRAFGIENIMALRGDPPKDRALPPEDRRDFPHAVDLVRHIRGSDGFCLGVAGYPEKHPEAPSMEEDLGRLKEKVQAGGDFVTTQLFFDNAPYFDFVERARGAGVACPILPGLMPVTNVAQLEKFASMCGASIPGRMARELAAIQADPEAVVRYGIEWTYAQARELLDRGAPGVHFYTLNRSRSTLVVLSRLLAAG